MCLITKRRKPSIAKEDMVVWKILKNQNAIYYDFKYEYDVEYKTRMTQEKRHFGLLAYDSISCTYLDGNYPKWGFERLPELIYIKTGFHSILHKERAKKSNGVMFGYRNIRKFIIPKGSRYYIDETGLCVSNRIIMIKEK